MPEREYTLKNYIKINDTIKQELREGISCCGSKCALSREIGQARAINISKMLNGDTKNIHKEKYEKLRMLVE